jgi:type VI secretion system protein VasG
MALLQAGAGIKGEFENRLKSLVEEVKRSPIPIILFIDEAHTMIGAGGPAGQSDAANILKPALARGELRTIAATTWSEYKKYFEKDPALARRFQVVKVEEPSEEQCLVMMRGITGLLEKHHKVRILDEGVAAAVKLSHRFIAGRQLPDKAVSVLDTACARLALGQNSTPAAIEDLQRRLDDLAVQESILQREANTGVDHSERLTSVEEQKATATQSLADLKAKWEQVSTLVGEIREVRTQLENLPVGSASADGDSLRQKLTELNHELDTLQGETPLLQVCVDGHIVGQVISGWTGIPLGKMVRDEISTVLELDKHLAKRVIGQDYPLKLIGQRIQTSRASLDDPGKPLGVFMLIGPSGVGKTETALALSDLLYGGEHNLISINMSEFQESHTVSTLKGSPPGYVGYGEGGVLTEAVRRRPYSVVLLDEVEKAHPDVLELFYQVFDKGRMEDGEGREIDFKNTIIILTTNACTDQMTKLTSDPETMPGPEALVKTLKPELNKIFKPAFLGRMVVIPFYPIRDEVLKRIIELKLGRIQRRMLDNHRIELKYDSAVVSEVAKRCTEVESGARNVDNILTNTLLPDVSRQLLTSIAEGRKLSSVTVGIGPDGAFQYS